MSDIQATNLREVQDAIQAAIAGKTRLEVRAAGTKRHLGREEEYDSVLDVSAMSGIVDYQPEELVMTLRAGTPMDHVEKALADASQMLAFEPPSMTRILGEAKAGVRGSIGGIVAANLSGSRRLTAGAARDFLLGFEAISGRGEQFKSGGKVMKNVTGYDLSKLMCGSYGTLAVMDEITLKTIPAPETSQSLLVGADSFAEAIKLVASIFATPHEPGSAASLPRPVAADEKADIGKAFTIVVRLEGIEPSVKDRLQHLQSGFGGDALEDKASRALWLRIRDVQPLAERPQDIWKVSCAPSEAPGLINSLDLRQEMRFFADWAGGLIWISSAAPDLGAQLRDGVAKLNSGFAMLVRDVGVNKEKLPALQPLTGGMHELHRRVKSSFDPLGVLNYGRMHEGV